MKIPALLFAGFCVVIIGMIMIIIASVLGGYSTSTGVVIFIGPFPLVFGAGPDAFWLIAISIITAFSMFILFLVLQKSRRDRKM